MRGIPPANRCLSLIVLLAISAQLWAAPIGLGVNSRGNNLDSQKVNALWRIDLATGDTEYVGWTSFIDLEALALDPDGTLFGADDDTKTLVRVSQVTGLAIPVGGAGNRSNMGVTLSASMDFGMSFDCEGQAFVVSDIEQSLFAANMTNGRLSLIGEAGGLGAPITDIAVYGKKAFGIGVGSLSDGSPAAPNLYRIDLKTGRSDLIGPLGAQVGQYNNAGLSFDEDGTLWAITDRRAVPAGDFPSEILRIDTETGKAEKVAETIVGIESLAIAPPSGCDDDDGRGALAAQPVPVAGWPVLLILTGLLGWVALVRIRRQG